MSEKRQSAISRVATVLDRPTTLLEEGNWGAAGEEIRLQTTRCGHSLGSVTTLGVAVSELILTTEAVNRVRRVTDSGS